MTGSCHLIGVRNDQRAIYRIRYDARMVWGTSPSSRVAACALVLVGCAVPVASPRDPPGQPLAIPLAPVTALDRDLPAAKRRSADDLHLACDSGDADSCGELSRLYDAGRGVPRSLSMAAALRAAGLYMEACDADDGAACTDLGFLYLRGFGVLGVAGADEQPKRTLGVALDDPAVAQHSAQVLARVSLSLIHI